MDGAALIHSTKPAPWKLAQEQEATQERGNDQTRINTANAVGAVREPPGLSPLARSRDKGSGGSSGESADSMRRNLPQPSPNPPPSGARGRGGEA